MYCNMLSNCSSRELATVLNNDKPLHDSRFQHICARLHPFIYFMGNILIVLNVHGLIFTLL